MNKIARRLGALERLWLVADRLSGPFAATLVVEGSGEIDIDRLRAAVEQVSAVAPGFSLKLHLATEGWVA